MNIANRILSANEGRDSVRLALKYKAMRTSPFVFLRGTCHLFYDRLPKTGLFKSAPLTWSCGDLHIENFGSYKGDNRLAYFDINDFDEGALAPATWELARVLTSILIGTKSYGISTKNAQLLASHFLSAYATALQHGQARWIERETAQGAVAQLLQQTRNRTRADFLDRSTQKKGRLRRFRLDGEKTLPASATQHAQVADFIRGFAVTQPNPAFYDVLDVAHRIAGTGSLGVERYAILVEGKGSPDQNYLLDLKKSQPSSIAKHLPSIQPAWSSDGERVVAVQRRMQAVSMAFLHPVIVEGKSYVLRDLQPSEDRIPWIKYTENVDQLSDIVQVMGKCVAWAQLRSSGRQGSAIADELIDFGERKKWRRKLLEFADEFAYQGQVDWQAYCQAYDEGTFVPDNQAANILHV